MSISSSKSSTSLITAALAVACLSLAACGQQGDGGADSKPRKLQVAGTLSCGPVGEWSGFEQPVSLLIDGSSITTEDLGVEPTAARFETWRGEIDGDKVTLTGRYKIPDRDPGPVELSGDFVDNELRLAGKRGPRKCTYASNRVEKIG